MYLQRILFVVSLVACMVGKAAAIQLVVPSALLTIDQNRPTVIERIVGEWGDRLASSNTGISPAQLREILGGLRADALLAASLAGSLDGLRDVVATAMTSTAPLKPGRVAPMALGDVNADLVYTPITPCRILDTRNGTTPPYNAQMVGGSAFPVTANLASFASQGGSATSCNLPAGAGAFAAIAVTLTVLNPNFDAFLAASNTSNFATLTQSVVMDFSANKGLANTAIVPVDGTVKFYLGLPSQVTTHVIADAVGYLRRPTNYGGTHTITGQYATDSGGLDNTASGFASTVGGGYSNTASGISSTVAGYQNTASADFSTVAGGLGNTASNYASTVAGGGSNTASDSYTTVGGGEYNTASGAFSTVAGGVDNIASGNSSTVAGGSSNSASGYASFAAGRRARAFGSGSFVWADSKNFDFINTVAFPNVFSVRATGGATFTTDIDGSGNPIRGVAILPGGIVDFGSNTRQMINLYGGATPSFGIGVQFGATYFRSNNAFCWYKNGVHSDTECDPGAGGTRLMRLDGAGNLYATSFTPLSDRNAKRDFGAVDSMEVLRKVAALPITTWSFKQDPTTRHIGPMAQDFAASFAVGMDDTHISTVDADGVALAAIQGLHQMLRQKEVQFAQQQREIEDLKRELNAIRLKTEIRDF